MWEGESPVLLEQAAKMLGLEGCLTLDATFEDLKFYQLQFILWIRALPLIKMQILQGQKMPKLLSFINIIQLIHVLESFQQN